MAGLWAFARRRLEPNGCADSEVIVLPWGIEAD
jgi:hypothetical protein